MNVLFVENEVSNRFNLAVSLLAKHSVAMTSGSTTPIPCAKIHGLVQEGHPHRYRSRMFMVQEFLLYARVAMGNL